MSSGSRSMVRPVFLFLLFAVVLTAGTGIGSAHAPLSVGSNEGITGATLISSPEKSFVLYTMLGGDGEAQYYRFPMENGQILYGSLQIPGPDSAVPDIVIIGQGISPSGNIPSSLEVPAGSSALLIQGKPPGKPSYEPFSPQPIYEVARFNITVPLDGDYYIAVTGPGGTKYSLAPGFREEFTAEEWLLVPWSVISIRLWEGQAPAGVFAPLIIIVIGGMVLAVHYWKKQGLKPDLVRWLILLCGLLYLGGAALTGMQMIYSVLLAGYSSGVVLTLLFMAGPLILGIIAVRAGIRSPGSDRSLMSGIRTAVVGILGLLLWAGLIIGPLLALAASAIILIRSAGKSGPA
ncbi:MAG TPA: hypothetical protein VFG36_07725 [Methanoregula sp.]|nr:hypothetical protein [Methanoregula sp.]